MAGNLPLLTIALGDPTWAQDINTNFQIIAAHTHSLALGTGQIIPADEISCVTSIDSYHGSTDQMSVGGVLFVGFNNQTTDIVASNTLYVKNSELYYANGTQFPVQITSNGQLNVKIVGGGGFTGNLTVYGASVTYNSSTDIYEFLGNSGSACILSVGVVNINSATITTANCAINLNGLSISNIAPAVSGTYLLLETTTYNPQIQIVPLSNYASTFSGAQSSIQQTNFTQNFVESIFETDIFCIIFTVQIAATFAIPAPIFYVTTPLPFISGQNSYQIHGLFPNAKGNNLFFSIYNRDGANLPVIIVPTISGSMANSLKFNFNSTYNQDLFTPLIMKSLNALEI